MERLGVSPEEHQSAASSGRSLPVCCRWSTLLSTTEAQFINRVQVVPVVRRARVSVQQCHAHPQNSVLTEPAGRAIIGKSILSLPHPSAYKDVDLEERVRWIWRHRRSPDGWTAGITFQLSL